MNNSNFCPLTTPQNIYLYIPIYNELPSHFTGTREAIYELESPLAFFSHFKPRTYVTDAMVRKTFWTINCFVILASAHADTKRTIQQQRGGQVSALDENTFEDSKGSSWRNNRGGWWCLTSGPQDPKGAPS
jgi:hypothetical protein